MNAHKDGPEEAVKTTNKLERQSIRWSTTNLTSQKTKPKPETKKEHETTTNQNTKTTTEHSKKHKNTNKQTRDQQHRNDKGKKAWATRQGHDRSRREERQTNDAKEKKRKRTKENNTDQAPNTIEINSIISISSDRLISRRVTLRREQSKYEIILMSQKQTAYHTRIYMVLKSTQPLFSMCAQKKYYRNITTTQTLWFNTISSLRLSQSNSRIYLY